MELISKQSIVPIAAEKAAFEVPDTLIATILSMHLSHVAWNQHSRRFLDLLLLIGLFPAVLMYLCFHPALTLLDKLRRKEEPFFSAPGGKALQHLASIASGRLSFVGPDLCQMKRWRECDINTAVLFADKSPGVFSLSKVKQATGIDFSDDSDYEREYESRFTFFSDLSIVLKGLLLIPFSRRQKELHAKTKSCRLFGLTLTACSLEDSISKIISLGNSIQARCSRVFFINAHCINTAAKSSEYMHSLRRGDLLLGDGIGLRIASKLLQNPINHNTNGTDLFYPLLRSLEKTTQSVFFLGGTQDVVKELVSRIQIEFPALKVAGYLDGFQEDNLQVAETIRKSKADILFVAKGVPRQEMWIDTYADRTGAKIAIAVGGLFDFYSGRIPRAPMWLREFGLEWAFRFYQEPARLFKRYFIGNPEFLLRTLIERRKLSKN